MKRSIVWVLVVAVAVLALGAGGLMAATEQAKERAINRGLMWLARTQNQTSGHWAYGGGRYDVAATASAALAFIEEGYGPGDTFKYDFNENSIIEANETWVDPVGKAAKYIFDRAQSVSPLPSEPQYDLPHPRHAEDYNYDGVPDAGGNNRAIQIASNDIYSNGIVVPMVAALGQNLGKTATIGYCNATSPVYGDTYTQVLQDMVDWFSWAQVEPNRGNYRGGWRYSPNSSSSDNSTAQWGALPTLYADSQYWGNSVEVPQYVRDELVKWSNYIQNPANGGSGYTYPTQWNNVSKTGGLILEFLATKYADRDGLEDAKVSSALAFINSRWNNGPSGTWYGNLNHPYAMWAAYKALFELGLTNKYGTGIGQDFLIGYGVSNAPGGITIGQDWDPKTSLAGDWYSHYCDYLVSIQNSTDGSWAGYSNWWGPLATGWYINILNAKGVPFWIPEPGTFVIWGGLIGLAVGCAWWRRRRKAA